MNNESAKKTKKEKPTDEGKCSILESKGRKYFKKEGMIHCVKNSRLFRYNEKYNSTLY